MESSGVMPYERGERLVLGFDAGCMTCSGLAARIEAAADDKLEVLALDDPRVEHWRKQGLGEDAPWAPTLIEVKGTGVKAWTGVRMGVALSRRLGPTITWRVMQALGEARSGTEADTSLARGSGPTRKQFIKGLAGGLVALSVLPATEAFAASGASGGVSVSAESRVPSGAAAIGRLKRFRSVKTADDSFGEADWTKVSKTEYKGGGERRTAYLIPYAGGATYLVAEDEERLEDARGIVMRPSYDGNGGLKAFTWYFPDGGLIGTTEIRDGRVVARRSQEEIEPLQSVSFTRCFLACYGRNLPRACIRLCERCRGPITCGACLACAGATGVYCAGRCLF